MSRKWHVERTGEMIDTYNTLAIKSEGKIQFGKLYLRMDNTEIDVMILAGFI
jgi:hypothetical protein